MKQGITKDVEITGICRAASNYNGVDGTTDDIVNLRYENGSWRSMPEYAKVYPHTGGLDYERVWVHVGMDYKHVFGVKNETTSEGDTISRLYWFANINDEGRWSDVEPQHLCDVDDNDLCNATGNLVAIGGNKFVIWQQGASQYTNFSYDENGNPDDEIIAPDGQIDFRVVPARSSDGNIQIVEVMERYTGEEECGISVDASGNLVPKAFRKVMNQTASAVHNMICREHESRNSFHSPFLVCAAYETYDGSYVLASRPLLMYPQSRFAKYSGETAGKNLIEGSTPAANIVTDSTVILNDGVLYANYKKSRQSLYTAHYIFKSKGKGNTDDNITLYEIEYKKASDATNQFVNGLSGFMPVMRRQNTLSESSTIVNNPNGKYRFVSENCYPTKNGYVSQGPSYTSGIDPQKKFYYNGALTKLQIRADSLQNLQKDVYTKLCVFVTPMISDTKDNSFLFSSLLIDEDGSDSSILGRVTEVIFSIDGERREGNDIIKDLIGSNFYKISEIDTTTITGDWTDVQIEDGVLMNIYQQDILPADTTTRSSVDARGSYSYNGRLHLYDYDSVQFRGWPLSYFFENEVFGCYPIVSDYDQRVSGFRSGDESRNNYWNEVWKPLIKGQVDETKLPSWFISVDIERDDGTCTVVRYAHRSLTGKKVSLTDVGGREIRDLNACLSYPDIRAKRMTIWVKQSKRTVRWNANTGKYELYQPQPIKYGAADNYFYQNGYYTPQTTLKLTPHRRLNMAVYIDPDLSPIRVVNPSPTNNNPATIVPLPTESNAGVRYANGMRCSAVDNPLYLPAEYSYRIGNTGIVGMMANEVAVGTGQTGDAPLMVFCKDGVFGLFVDASGQLAYGYSRPIAGDVCTSAASITRVDGGIVFSTERGLMMLKGATAVDIGEIAEGDYVPFADITGYFRNGKCVNGAFEHTAIADLGGRQTAEDFLDYQRNAVVGYNHKDREILVCQPDKDYIYLKDYEGRWRRLGLSVKEVISCYPDTYILTDEGIFTLDRMRGIGNRRIFFLTRPLNLRNLLSSRRDSQDMKEHYRVIARGEYHTDNNTLLGLYILGSYDGRQWSVIGGNERHGDFVDIGALTERCDMRYIMVCLAGDIGVNGRIDGLTIEGRQK